MASTAASVSMNLQYYQKPASEKREGRGAKRKRNSADLAARSEGACAFRVLREFLKRARRRNVSAAALSRRSGEVILLRLVVPQDLLVVPERQRRHVARNRGLLADHRIGDHFGL